MPVIGGIQIGKRGGAFLMTDIRGLPEVLRKFRGDPLHARPWKRALYDVLRVGKRLAQERAPGGPGSRLARRMRYYAGPRGANVPTYGAVTNNATNRGFRYGFALDAGHAQRHSYKREAVTEQRTTKTGRTYNRHIVRKTAVSAGRQYTFHYGGGSRPTRQWFEGVRNLLRPYFTRRMSQLVAEVEKEWRDR